MGAPGALWGWVESNVQVQITHERTLFLDSRSNSNVEFGIFKNGWSIGRVLFDLTL